MDPATRLIRLELRDAPGPPAGVALGEAGARREFDGWLGLIAALDGLIAGDAPLTATHERED